MCSSLPHVPTPPGSCDLKQQSTEQNWDFVRRLVDAADQCDLERMTRQEFLIMCIITNTIDEELRSELCKMMEPDWTKVRSKCEELDRARLRPKQGSTQAPTAMEVKQATGGQQTLSSGKKKKGQKDPVRQQNYLKLKGRCFNCGDPGHSKKDCTLPASTQCTKCKKLGHLAKVCMNSGPLDIQPIAKARQARDDDAHMQQLEYHPDAVPATSNTVTQWSGDPGTAFAHVARRAGTPTFWL